MPTREIEIYGKMRPWGEPFLEHAGGVRRHGHKVLLYRGHLQASMLCALERGPKNSRHLLLRSSSPRYASPFYIEATPTDVPGRLSTDLVTDFARPKTTIVVLRDEVPQRRSR